MAPDVFTREKRSAIMASVRSKNSKAEVSVRSILHRMGLRFRLHEKRLLGKPDIVLPKHKTALFVHGCFWHRHGCKHSSSPKSNTEFWKAKFARNILRFKEVKANLEDQNWNVQVVWECETKDKESLKTLLGNMFAGVMPNLTHEDGFISLGAAAVAEEPSEYNS